MTTYRLRQWGLLLAFFMFYTANINGVRAQTESSSLYPYGVRLSQPVILTKEEKRYIESLPSLGVGTVNSAAPFVIYNADKNKYEGISSDVFNFIAEAINLNYHFVNEEDLPFSTVFQQFEEGKVDILFPISLLAERADIGYFTDPYYENYYSIIMRGQERPPFLNYEDLAPYKIGVAEKSSIIPYLETFLSAEQIHTYPSSDYYQALRDGEVDVVLASTVLFAQDRYRLELFDLEDVQRLYEYPRHYAFLFKRTPELAPLVAIFNRYLIHLDNKASIFSHENHEYQIVERYLHGQFQKKILLISLSLISVLLLGFIVAYKQRQNLLLKLEEMTRIDSLTGLANRRAFDEMLQLQHQHCKRDQKPLSIIMLDIDFFKNVNDSYGHMVGDQYLKTIASALAATVQRSTDLVARYGGEEFICLLPDTPLESALNIAEKMRKAIMDLNLSSGNESYHVVTASAGVATLNKGKGSVKELLEGADTQLYKAKGLGRNRGFGQPVC